jgi:Ca-activated chloride channel homolog
VSEVYPQRMPDLFVGRPVIVSGRFDGNADGVVTIRGRVGGQVKELRVPVQQADDSLAHAALPGLWARSKIADLGDRATWDGSINVSAAVLPIALEYGLISPYTAFVAVDASGKTAGDFGVTVPVAVPVPEGVKYETTVQEETGASPKPETRSPNQ